MGRGIFYNIDLKKWSSWLTFITKGGTDQVQRTFWKTSKMPTTRPVKCREYMWWFPSKMSSPVIRKYNSCRACHPLMNSAERLGLYIYLPADELSKFANPFRKNAVADFYFLKPDFPPLVILPPHNRDLWNKLALDSMTCACSAVTIFDSVWGRGRGVWGCGSQWDSPLIDEPSTLGEEDRETPLSVLSELDPLWLCWSVEAELDVEVGAALVFSLKSVIITVRSPTVTSRCWALLRSTFFNLGLIFLWLFFLIVGSFSFFSLSVLSFFSFFGCVGEANCWVTCCATNWETGRGFRVDVPFLTSHIMHLNASALFLNVQTLQSQYPSSEEGLVCRFGLVGLFLSPILLKLFQVKYDHDSDLFF